MILAASFSFNNGDSAIKERYSDLLQEIMDAITSVNALDCKTKKSKEKTRDSARWLGMWPCHRSERFFWAPGSAGARAGACGAQNVKTVHPPDRRAMS